MHSLKHYLRPFRTVFMSQKEEIMTKDTPVTFVDSDGFSRSGVVFEVREDNPDDKYLGREDWLYQESVSAEYPVMYWVLENGVRELENLWTVKFENGMYRGQRGFLTSYGLDVHSDDYDVLCRLKKIVMSNVIDDIDTIEIRGVKFNINGWAITGASETLTNLWEEILNA